MLRKNGFNLGIILLNCIVILIAGAGVYQVYEKAGFLAHVSSAGNRVAIGRLLPRAPATFREQVQPGDIIVTVDGIAVDNATAYETILDEHAVGDEVTLGIKRGLETKTVTLPLDRFYSTIYLVLIVLIGTLFFSLGVLVMWKRPHDDASLIFHLAMNCSTIMIMATAGRFTVAPDGLGHIVRIAFIAAYAYMTLLFFHFTLIFPSPKWPRVRRAMPWLYGISTLIALVASALFVLASTTAMERWVGEFSQAFEICQMSFGAMGLISVASFIHSYRSSKEESERQKLRWVLTGVAVGFLTFIALSLIPTTLLHIPPLVNEEWIILIVGVAPITFAIAIVRHRVMDIDLILSRSTVYTIVLGAVVLVYTGLVTLFGQIVNWLGWSDIVSRTIATIISALLFAPVRTRVQRFVDRRFFRTRYNLRQAQRTLAEKLNTCMDSTSLTAAAARTLDATLAPERIAFAIVRPADNTIAVLSSHASGTAEQMPDVLSNEARITSGELYASERWIEHGVEHSHAANEMLDKLGVCCAIAVSMNASDTAMLLVGPKKSGTRYTLEDLDVLRAAITHTSTGLERITLQTNVARRELEAEQLRELDRVRSTFVSNVTHELKTPLTSIRMFAELLQSGRAVEAMRVSRYARIIEAESVRLARLIDNVLDFSKLENGTDALRLKCIEFTKVVDSVVESLEYQLTNAGFVLRRSDDGGPITLLADADAVTGALVNLISNAIKYSPNERAIDVRTFRRRNSACVSIADRGIGLSAEDRDRIFDPFYRTDAGKSIGASGTGLGLTLVRHVVEAHGGTIEVESTVGHGSTFTLLFPVNDDENNSADRG